MSGRFESELERARQAEALGYDGAGGRVVVVDEVGFVPDGTTEADLKQQWADAEKARVDREHFEGNRAERRARERENRRAAKLATIQQISRGIR